MQKQEQNTPSDNKAKLIISPNAEGAAPLTKAQKTFNRLIKEIKEQEANLEDARQILDQSLHDYARHVAPLEQQVSECKQHMLRLMYGLYYHHSGVKYTQKEEQGILKRMMLLLDNEIKRQEQPTEEQKDMFRTLRGQDYDQARQEEFRQLMQHIEAECNEWDIKFDPSLFNINMSYQEMLHTMDKLNPEPANLTKLDKAPNTSRKKTKKRLAQEAKQKEIDQAKDKSISWIYKQLAKLLHPDLEQDPAQKQEKEMLMKQLTVAYDNNDLHSLLQLELTYMAGHTEHVSQLADSQLEIYNAILKEQKTELEQALAALVDHSRYTPLYPYTGGSGVPLFYRGSAARVALQAELEDYRVDIDALQSATALRELKKIGKQLIDQLSRMQHR